MDWLKLVETVLETVLYFVITTGLPILFGYGISYLKTKRTEKLQTIDNTYVKETITQATDVIINAVNTVAQNYVDDLKKTGSFDLDKQKIALEKAVTQAKVLLNNDATNLVIEKYNDLDDWIRSQIESYIKSTKVIVK